MTQPLWRMVWRCLKKKKKKTRTKLSYDPARPLRGIYPEKILTEKDTRTPMFIIALFTLDRTWKQLRCPSTDKWIKKLVDTYNELLVIKRNTFKLVLVR